MQFLPGQWLDTYVPGVAKAGGFTITSPPSAAAAGLSERGADSEPAWDSASGEDAGLQHPYLELAVQESPENPAAAWLWQPENEILGAELRVRVGGSFVFPPPIEEKDISRVVLVAGGVGVNPLVSIMGSMAEQRHKYDVRVLYATKMPRSGELRDIVFLSRIAAMFTEERLSGRLQLFATGDEAGRLETDRVGSQLYPGVLEVAAGRFNDRHLLDAVGSGPDAESAVVYICGPPDMTDETIQMLTDPDGAALDPRRVLTEKWW